MKTKVSTVTIILLLSVISVVYAESLTTTYLVFSLPDDVLLDDQTQTSFSSARDVWERSDLGKSNADPTLYDLHQWIEENGGQTLTGPQIYQETNEKAQLSVVSETQYMEWSPEGNLIVHEVKDEKAPGLWLETTVIDNDLSTELTLDYELTVRVISDRKQLDGVSLPVGQPQYKNYSSRQSMPITPDKWYLIDAIQLVDQNPGQSSVLFVMCLITI